MLVAASATAVVPRRVNLNTASAGALAALSRLCSGYTSGGDDFSLLRQLIAVWRTWVRDHSGALKRISEEGTTEGWHGAPTGASALLLHLFTESRISSASNEGNYIGDSPNRAVSLLEIMERFFPTGFQAMAWVLGYTEGVYSGVVEMGLADAPLDQSAADMLKTRLKVSLKECERIGMNVCAIHIKELLSQLDQNKMTFKSMRVAAGALNANLGRELGSAKFFRLSPNTQGFYGAENLFGEEVAKAFPSTDYDIRESGNSLALGRCTACVYHAMRVLEHGLCALAAHFKIPFDNKLWNDVIEPIEKAIRLIKSQPKKPRNWKANEQFYSEAAAQFMHFKNAWRNYTAHKQFKYTDEEAEAIFRHVRDFMKHPAKRLQEKR